MIAAIALVDLDDTLFQTRRKCPPGLDPAALTPMAFDREGAPLSFATPEQMRWIDWLRQGTVLVPVTGRSVDALRRVDLAFDLGVAAHGGVILRQDGAPCPAWAAHIDAQAKAHDATLRELEQALRASAAARALDINVRIIGEGETGLYLVAKHRQPEREDELHALADQFAGQVASDWTFHRNGNNVAYLPPFLGKRHAVAHLLDELRAAHPGLPVIGIGDSVTDAPFLQLCDFAMMPTGSQLAGHAFAALETTA